MAASWVLPALPPAVRELRERLGVFADGHGMLSVAGADLRLAASEALTNVVVHAYRDRIMPGTVTASIKVDHRAGRIEVRVSDEGVGMGVGWAPRADSPGAGYGLEIIAAVSEAMTIRPGASATGTVVSFSFALN